MYIGIMKLKPNVMIVTTLLIILIMYCLSPRYASSYGFIVIAQVHVNDIHLSTGESWSNFDEDESFFNKLEEFNVNKNQKLRVSANIVGVAHAKVKSLDISSGLGKLMLRAKFSWYLKFRIYVYRQNEEGLWTRVWVISKEWANTESGYNIGKDVWIKARGESIIKEFTDEGSYRVSIVVESAYAYVQVYVENVGSPATIEEIHGAVTISISANLEEYKTHSYIPIISGNTRYKVDIVKVEVIPNPIFLGETGEVRVHLMNLGSKLWFGSIDFLYKHYMWFIYDNIGILPEDWYNERNCSWILYANGSYMVVRFFITTSRAPFNEEGDYYCMIKADNSWWSNDGDYEYFYLQIRESQSILLLDKHLKIGIIPNAPIPLKLNVTELSEGLLLPGDIIVLHAFTPLKCISLFNTSKQCATQLKILVSPRGEIRLPYNSLSYGLLASPPLGLFNDKINNWKPLMDKSTYLILNMSRGKVNFLINITVLIGDIRVYNYSYYYDAQGVNISLYLMWTYKSLSKPITEPLSPIDWAEWFENKIWTLAPLVSNSSLIESLHDAVPLNNKSWTKLRLSFDKIRAYMLSSYEYPARFSLINYLLLGNNSLINYITAIGLSYSIKGTLARSITVIENLSLSPYLKVKLYAKGEYDGSSKEEGIKAIVYVNDKNIVLLDENDGLLDGYIYYENQELCATNVRYLFICTIPGIPHEAEHNLIILIPWWDVELSISS